MKDDMSELLADPDFVTSFTLKETGGYRVAGKWTETIVETPKEGVIQPMSAGDTRFLQEGDKTKSGIKVYCAFEVSASSELPPKLGDMIDWHNKTYRIAKAPDDWSEYGYWKAIAVQVDENG